MSLWGPAGTATVVLGYLAWEHRHTLHGWWCHVCHRRHHGRVGISRYGVMWACQKCDRDWWEDA